MKFVELEALCKIKEPMSATWVRSHRSSIQEAVEEYKSWGNDFAEEQETFHNLVWDLYQTWSYELIGELMPHLSVENKTTELVRMVEAIGGENEVQYNRHCNLALCEPFFKQHAHTVPVCEQIEVLQSLINQEYSNQECLATAVRLAEITIGAIDWTQYEQEREESNEFYWKLSSEVVLATEHRTHYDSFFKLIRKAHPDVFFSALQYVVVLQTQDGYCPSPDRIELFNGRVMDFVDQDFYEDVFNCYSTVNNQLARRDQPPLQIPPRVLNFVLQRRVEETTESSAALRTKKM